MTISPGSSNKNVYHDIPENHPRGDKRPSTDTTTSSSKRQKTTSSSHQKTYRSEPTRLKDMQAHLFINAPQNYVAEHNIKNATPLGYDPTTSRIHEPLNSNNYKSNWKFPITPEKITESVNAQHAAPVDNRFTPYNSVNEARSENTNNCYFLDGSSYTGEVKEGRPHGQGTLHHFNGDLLYEGSWENGTPIEVGKGKLLYQGYRCLGDLVYIGKNYRTGGLSFALTGNGHITLYRLENGVRIYDGSWNNFKFHGIGTEFNIKGKIIYQGEFLENKRHGQGKLFLSNGSWYEGEFLSNKPHGRGRGKIHYPSGSTYEGEFLNNERHGKGKVIFSNGDWYKGEFRNNKPHGKGKGKIHYSNGGWYEGELLNNKPHGKGKGKTIYASGSTYEGEFLNNERHGKGKFIHSSRGWYEGEFRNNKPHGKGKGKNINASGSSYEGEFLNNKRHGKGKFIFSNGDWYKGEFQNNKPHGKGKGKIHYSNGGWYEGEFKKGKRHGEGVYHYKSDTNRGKYEGMYKNGKRNGFGREYDQKGELIASVYWEEGVLKPRRHLLYSSGYEPELSDGDRFIPSYEDVFHSDLDNDSSDDYDDPSFRLFPTNNIHHVRYGLDLAPEPQD